MPTLLGERPRIQAIKLAREKVENRVHVAMQQLLEGRRPHSGRLNESLTRTLVKIFDDEVLSRGVPDPIVEPGARQCPVVEDLNAVDGLSIRANRALSADR